MLQVAVLLRSSGELVIAFRGTETTVQEGMLQDWAVNVQMRQVPFSDLAGFDTITPQTKVRGGGGSGGQAGSAGPLCWLGELWLQGCRCHYTGRRVAWADLQGGRCWHGGIAQCGLGIADLPHPKPKP